MLFSIKINNNNNKWSVDGSHFHFSFRAEKQQGIPHAAERMPLRSAQKRARDHLPIDEGPGLRSIFLEFSWPQHGSEVNKGMRHMPFSESLAKQSFG